jgi:D-alanine transaminase
MRQPMSLKALAIVLREAIRRNRVRNGIVYLQVTRGAAPRDFPFPAEDTPPTIVVTARSSDPARIAKLAEQGMAVITVPDIRWQRVDIKSVALLPNVLAKQTARDRGAREAWLVDARGYVTEGGSSNAWIVTADGALVTRPLGTDILPGVTRSVVLDLVAAEGLRLEERAFTVEEAYAAREAFVTSASQTVMPVVRIDDRAVGDGKPGPLAKALRRDFYRQAELS